MSDCDCARTINIPADLIVPFSSVGIKRSAPPRDHEERPGGWCKGVSSHQSTGKGKVVAHTEDHGANERKRRRRLAIDLNMVPHHNDGDLDIPLPATVAVGNSFLPSPPRAPSLENELRTVMVENKKLKLELAEEELKQEQRRQRWAAAKLREDIELLKMREENDRMRLENHRLRVQVLRKELERMAPVPERV